MASKLVKLVISFNGTEKWEPWFNFFTDGYKNMAGNRISTQTGIGTAIAIAGVAIYSLIKANIEEQKRVRSLTNSHNSLISAWSAIAMYKSDSS